MSVETKNLASAGSWASTSSLVGNLSTDLTQTYQFPKSVLDAVYAGLAAANTFTAQNTFAGGTITTSKPVTISQTWNAGGVTFTGLFVNITNTASASASLLADLQIGGVTQFNVRKDGSIVCTAINFTSNAYFFDSVSNANARDYSHATLGIDSNFGFYANKNSGVTWSGNNTLGAFDKDTGLGRNAAGVVEVNNGTLGVFSDIKIRELRVDGTITASGQTGDKNINKGCGTVRFPSGVSPALTLTNSLITANTLVFTQVRANGLANLTIGQSAQSSGTITLTALGTLAGETEVAFFLVEPT
jgi:hypothetical protein